jgi:outer membrane protein assembly factor BamD
MKNCYLCAMNFKYIKLALVLGFLPIVLASCGEYNKVLKSTDLTYKYEMAEKYFNQEDYTKALPLLEELITLYRGTNKAEKLYYYFAYCHYHIGDFYLASYYFKNFASTYPASQYSEECVFMSAICQFRNSPKPSLDQTNTEQAISEMQLFVNKYPESARLDTCNLLIDKMRSKLEVKSYEMAMLYFKTEFYQSAAVSLKNTLVDYPNSQYKESIMFHILQSNYRLAMNSVSTKKEVRLKDTVKSYHKFVGSFGESEYSKEAGNILDNAKKQLEKLGADNS